MGEPIFKKDNVDKISEFGRECFHAFTEEVHGPGISVYRWLFPFKRRNIATIYPSENRLFLVDEEYAVHAREFAGIYETLFMLEGEEFKIDRGRR